MLETAGLDSAVLDAGIAAQQLQLVNAIVDEDRQYATRLTITRTDNENASESVISTVISWLMKKKVLSKEYCDSFRDGAYSTPDGWKGTTELEQGKTALASKRNSGVPGCVVWAMELDEQDLTVPTDNEMGMAYAKYLIDRYTRYGENRFINVLRQGICRASDRVAGDILSIADVRWLDGIDEAKRLSSRIKKLKQRVKGDSGGNETVDSLRDEISGLQKDIADWEEIASELETSNSEAAAKIDMLTRDAMRLENEKRAVERKLEMAELEQLNANALNGIRKALTVVPENLTQLLDLAKVLYPDRIVILPDAYRSAKKFDGILTEEWEILVAVATTLWDLCFKETVNDRLGSEFKKRTGYELARGESGTTCAMPNLMKLRKRMYKGKEIDISPHIKGRNIKAAFRLHFYIDRDEEKIVIGHAGEHMDTAGTPRR